MGAKISVLGMIMSFPPISEVCDGTVSLKDTIFFLIKKMHTFNVITHLTCGRPIEVNDMFLF